jgi:hypothetical protein
VSKPIVDTAAHPALGTHPRRCSSQRRPADQRAAIISVNSDSREVVGRHRRRAELLDEFLATLDADERRVLRDAASAMLLIGPTAT